LELLQSRGRADSLAVQPRAQQRDAVAAERHLGLDLLDLSQRAHAANSEVTGELQWTDPIDIRFLVLMAGNSGGRA
jgi:hypothetical protein